ncbi:MAG: Nif11-like leader peptide family RiPP precursor [Defluviitaleaceae bacterium]|nr:Nif11-like leader peptide family RiPP precursor [Defluviitaleaceae bacterium]
MEKLQLILAAMETDMAFAEEMNPLFENEKVAEIIAAAKKKGFEVTEADWKGYTEWVEGLTAEHGGTKELNEDDLDAVAGGTGGSGSTGCFYIGSRDIGDAKERDQNGRVGFGGRLANWCKSPSCKALIPYRLLTGGSNWVTCPCWGTSNCVNKWHLHDTSCVKG